jgi:hypothetical protein
MAFRSENRVKNSVTTSFADAIRLACCRRLFSRPRAFRSNSGCRYSLQRRDWTDTVTVYPTVDTVTVYPTVDTVTVYPTGMDTGRKESASREPHSIVRPSHFHAHSQGVAGRCRRASRFAAKVAVLASYVAVRNDAREAGVVAA